jgi:hypothetical protein
MSGYRFLPWLLLASLAANIFLLSALLTRPGHMGPPPPPRGPLGMIEAMAEGLEAADADILRAALAAEIQRTGQLPADRPPGPGRLQTIMASDPFDAQQFQQEADAMQADRNAMSAALTRIMLDALPRISPQGRQKMAAFRPGPPPKDRQK